ncbi:M48 family metallopeptidase [Microvirga sp. 3-52]|uniref:M48 family metallopeptidase n=1 Tax=Microvirga sp. 3-52 TaxID=2792425 RepID=UPI001AC724F0|nr:SprT family zinc-dependent metalloprotease [Microvirga sp. 3-52]MBO1906556.1 M48 family metallopeptidase [Microvirga sp. 3-52]MBS7453845.1 M48 family metallopeptidase [Microvirga sp. 3-52]
MPVLTVGTTDISYTLKRSGAARRARITVTPGAVEVVVPTSATDDEIAGVLHRRRERLLDQTRSMASRVTMTPKVAHFVTGAKIPYRGRLMRLRDEPSDGSFVEVSFRNGFLVGCPRAMLETSRDPLIESALRLWLRKRLREDVTAFVRQHGEPNGLKPTRLEIKSQKHLWGSCGRDRVVNLNWQLIFAPKTVLEYAVVHELCHLRHRTHDQAFWNLVGSILPDWESRKTWLDRNEHFLELQRVETE